MLGLLNRDLIVPIDIVELLRKSARSSVAPRAHEFWMVLCTNGRIWHCWYLVGDATELFVKFATPRYSRNRTLYMYSSTSESETGDSADASSVVPRSLKPFRTR